MTHAQPIAGARLLEFIGDSGPAVLLVSVHRRHAFNTTMARLLSATDAGIRLGIVNVLDLLATGGGAVPFLIASLASRGTTTSFGVLPGYYLFANGRMLAWDAGLPTTADGESIAGSLLLGTIWTGVTRDFSFMAQAVHLAADETGATRVAARFRDLLACDHAQSAHAREYRSSASTDLGWACQTLGVGPHASEREIQQAWRRLRIEHHPDHARDRSDFERRSKLSVEVNHARDILLKRRSA